MDDIASTKSDIATALALLTKIQNDLDSKTSKPELPESISVKLPPHDAAYSTEQIEQLIKDVNRLRSERDTWKQRAMTLAVNQAGYVGEN